MHAVTKSMPVPFLDLTSQYKELEAEWLAAIRETGNRGSFVLGPHVQAFEKEFAEYVGVKHAIGVANGTDSLYLSLRALGVGPGDEVITTPFTFFASAETIDMVGATPVFADILPDSFCLDPARLLEQRLCDELAFRDQDRPSWGLLGRRRSRRMGRHCRRHARSSTRVF